MFTRYIVALCLTQLCIVETVAHSRDQGNNLRVIKNLDDDISHIEQTWMDIKPLARFGSLVNKSSWNDDINERINLSKEPTISKEPMSLIALTPKPLLDAVSGVRTKIEKALYGVLEDVLKKTGARDLIDDALKSIKSVTDTLMKSVTGLFKLTPPQILFLGKNLDKMFQDRSTALYKHLDGKCFKGEEGDGYESDEEESMRMRRLFQEPNRKLIENYVPPNINIRKKMGEILTDLTNEMKNPTDNLKPRVITCNNGTLKSIEADFGAVSVNIQGLLGAKFQTKSGIYLESLLDIGIDAGVTIPEGNLRLSGNAGMQISFGKEDMSNLNKTQGSNQTERVIKSGTKKNHKSNTMEKIKNSTSFEFRGEAGVKIYLPGFSSAMDGWGGLDIGFTLAALPHFDGLTFHLRHPWYACRSCSGNVQASTDIFNPSKWSVTGFTVNFFKFYNLEELKNKTSKFPGVGEVLTKLKDSFDVSTWEKNKDFSLTLGSHLSIGLDSTRCDWDLDANFKRQPYGGAIPQCGTNKCNRKIEAITSSKIVNNEYMESNHFKAMVDSMRLSREERDLQKEKSNNDNNAVRGIMSVLIEFLGNGGIIVPYCFGKCEESHKNKYIKGNITVQPPETCDGVVVQANAEEITVANTGYLILNEISPKIANLVSDNLGGFGQLGIKSPSITLEVTMYPKIVCTISGSPMLPNLPKTGGFDKVIFDGLKRMIEGLTIEIKATLQSLEFAEMGFKVASKPLKINKYVQFEDSKGHGFNVYAKYKINQLPTPTSQILTFGLNIPMRICTANCKKQPHEQEKIFLNGDINTELTINTNAVPPSLTMGGVFTMIGTWNKAFGIPIIHISNVIAGASFDISKVFPPPPSKIVIGGAVCLGSQTSCYKKTPKNFIQARMYLKLNANAPKKNGFIGMVTTVTIEHMLNAAGGFHKDIKKLTDKVVKILPKDLKESGIYPFKSNAAGCDKPENNTALALGDDKLNLNCYAYVSVAPLQTVTIEEVSLEIPRGISFSGRLNLFNRFDLRAEGNIDVFVPGSMKFKIDATIMNFNLGKFLEVGAEYKNGKLIGNATFYVDFKQAPLSVNVYIQCAVHIPFLSTYGQVKIDVNNEMAKFKAKISVFGGIFKPYAHIEWRWDMTKFFAEFGGIKFLGGVLTVEKLKMEIDITGGSFKKASFSADISVLNFIKIGGSFGVEKLKTKRYKMDFRVYANLGIVAGSAWGTAILDTKKIQNTKIADIGVKLEAPQWLKDFGKMVGQFFNAVGEFLSDVFSFAADMLQAIGKELAKLGKAVLEYFKNIGKGFARAFDALMNGNIGEALKALAETFKKALQGLLNAIAAVGKAIWNTLKKVWGAITNLFKGIADWFRTIKNERTHTSNRTSVKRTDEAQCQYRREKYFMWKTWRQCGKGWWKNSCSNKSTRKKWVEEDKKNARSYQNCLNDRKKQAKDAEKSVERGGKISDAVKDTKNQNKKILKADVNNLPERSVNSDGNFKGKVPAGSTKLRVTVNGDARKLKDNRRKTFKVEKDMEMNSNDNVKGSVTALEEITAKKTSKIYTENLGNANGLIKVVNKGGWSSYKNSFRNNFHVASYHGGRQGGFCGVSSYHDNRYEDRRFRFKFCTPNIKTRYSGKYYPATTQYDQSWTSECAGNYFIAKMDSWYHNNYKDRKFRLVCGSFDGFEKGKVCEWSNEGAWVNGWDRSFNFECGENKMLTAIKSTHSNKYEDRLYSFKCCHIMKQGPLKIISWTNYLNHYDRTLKVYPKVDGKPATICGVSSHHNNRYEDRRYKFRYCAPRGAKYQSHRRLSLTPYDRHWKKECPGNRFVSNIESHHSNRYQDRRFDIYCGEFRGYSRNNEVCEWSNGNHWVNKWDADFTFGCPSKSAIVAIESYHSNRAEDRRFKFKCCRIQEKL